MTNCSKCVYSDVIPKEIGLLLSDFIKIGPIVAILTGTAYLFGFFYKIDTELLSLLTVEDLALASLFSLPVLILGQIARHLYENMRGRSSQGENEQYPPFWYLLFNKQKKFVPWRAKFYEITTLFFLLLPLFYLMSVSRGLWDFSSTTIVVFALSFILIMKEFDQYLSARHKRKFDNSILALAVALMLLASGYGITRVEVAEKKETPKYIATWGDQEKIGITALQEVGDFILLYRLDKKHWDLVPKSNFSLATTKKPVDKGPPKEIISPTQERIIVEDSTTTSEE